MPDTSGRQSPLGLSERIGEVRRVAVVLVDGMGTHLLERLTADAPLLTSALAGKVGSLGELTCAFPSTTPTSLVSLSTGVLPGEHGVLGFTVKLPGSDRVLNHLVWRDDPPPARWQPVSTWFERLARAGVRTRALLPAGFLGSGLTQAAYRGAQFCAAATGLGYGQRLADELATAPGLVYGYTAELDTAAHLFGIGSPQWHTAAAHVNELLTRLVEALPPDAALLVTADHGGLNAPATAPVDIGDVVVVCSGDLTVLASGHEPPEVARLIGIHGAATPAEMAIPLIALRG